MTRWTNTGKTCSIDGCDKPMRARRWCTLHYHRWRSYGDPEYETALTNPAVLVWTLPSCVQCLSTKRQLEKRGIPYIARDLTDHPDKADEFRARELLTAPIVETSIGTWSGFRPDLIKALAAKEGQ